MKSVRTVSPRIALSIGLCTALLAMAPASADEPGGASATSQSTSPFDVVKMPGGVEYRELAVGTGTMAYPGNTVGVQYTGWLQNPDGSRGAQFDSSRNTGLPLEFVLGDGKVIRGWEIGMQGMKVGGKRRLIIPPSLAYGAKGTSSIPPYSTLIFDVELVNVK
jgi:FKBP-type peptidyl-prolyl cis-trans isomerase FkpA